MTLVFPGNDAEIRIVSNASDKVMGASLEKRRDDNFWQSLSFFSRKFTPPQLEYSTYGRELTAVYAAILHCHYFIECHQLKVFSDHKPLQHALHQTHQEAPLRRQLAYISEHTSCICYIPGKDSTGLPVSN